MRQSNELEPMSVRLSQNVCFCSFDPSLRQALGCFSTRDFFSLVSDHNQKLLAQKKVLSFTRTITPVGFFPKSALGANRYHNSSPLEVVKSFN